MFSSIRLKVLESYSHNGRNSTKRRSAEFALDFFIAWYIIQNLSSIFQKETNIWPAKK
jgi:hypothetical protein